MADCIDEVLESVGETSVKRKDAITMLTEYEKHLEAQKTTGDLTKLDLTGDEQFARHLAKRASQRKYSWLKDKVTLEKQFNLIDFKDGKTIRSSFDEINSTAQRRISSNVEILDAQFTKSLKPEDRLLWNTNKFDEEQTAKFVGQMMTIDETKMPKISQVEGRFHPEFRIAEAVSKLYKDIHLQKNNYGANTGFLEGYIGRNNYDQVKYASPEKIAEFKKDALERFNFDEMYIGDKTQEGFIDQMVDKIRNGIWENELDEITFYDEVAETQKKIKNFTQGSIAERLGKQRVVQMKPEDALYMQQKYGSGGLKNIVATEINGWGRAKGLIESFGSNPDKNYDTLVNRIVDNSLDIGGKGFHPIAKRGLGYKDYLLGRLKNPSGHLTSRVFNSMRTFMSALHLGQGVVTAFADIATPGLRKSHIMMEKNIGGNLAIMGESLTEQLGMLVGQYGDDVAKRIVKVELEYLEDSFLDLVRESRFGGDVIGIDAKGRTTGGAYSMLNLVDDAHDTINKWNFIDKWTQTAIRRQYAPISREFGEFADKSFDELHDAMQAHLKRHGLVEDWDIIRSRVIASEDGRKYVDPKAFNEIELDEIAKFYPDLQATRSLQNKKSELDSLLRAAFSKEAEHRVLMPDLTTSANVAFRFQRGNIAHELAMSAFQFKSYSFALWKKLILPAFSTGGFAPIAAFTAFSMGTNMLITWFTDFLNNRSARPFFNPPDPEVGLRNWGALVTRAVGYPFADELIGKTLAGEFRSADLVSIAGPMLGDTVRTFGELSGIAKGLKDGDTDKISKNAFKLALGTPVVGAGMKGATLIRPLTNLWQDTVLEQFSPGHLRQREKYKEQQGSESLIDLQYL